MSCLIFCLILAVEIIALLHRKWEIISRDCAGNRNMTLLKQVGGRCCSRWAYPCCVAALLESATGRFPLCLVQLHEAHLSHLLASFSIGLVVTFKPRQLDICFSGDPGRVSDKLVGRTCCYPFDVVKNRIQAAPDTSPPLHRNGWHCAQEIYRFPCCSFPFLQVPESALLHSFQRYIPPSNTVYSDTTRKVVGLHRGRGCRAKGWRGFLAGFSPCLLRSVPANAAAFTAYELTMHFLPMRTPSFGPNRS